MTKTGTLEELDVKKGDVVKRDVPNGEEWTIKFVKSGEFLGVKPYYTENHKGKKLRKSYNDWVVVSRASDRPRRWKELTDQEQGALLLAQHRGETIEYLSAIDEWRPTFCNRPSWQLHTCYRVKPKPVVGALTMCGHISESLKYAVFKHVDFKNPSIDNHRLVFSTQDGRVVTGTFTNEDGDVVALERIDDHS